MANLITNYETSAEERKRLKLRIEQLTIAKKERKLDLKNIETELEACREGINKLGDFP